MRKCNANYCCHNIKDQLNIRLANLQKKYIPIRKKLKF